MEWIKTEDRLPEQFMDVLLYREDAGVFPGYYGNVAESLPDHYVEHLYNEGLTEEGAWEVCFWSYGFGYGVAREDNKEAPTHWMPLPLSPNE